MIRVIFHQPTYTTHPAHDWQLNARPAPYGVTDVCARCGYGADGEYISNPPASVPTISYLKADEWQPL